MVLITVGSTRNDFSRLIKAVDELCEHGLISSAFAQIGTALYEPRYMRYERFVSRDELHRLIVASAFVITHAGTGTVNTCLTERKKAIVVPRDPALREHPDDHQTELAAYLAERGRALVATTAEELRACVQEISRWSPRFQLAQAGETRAVRMLAAFLAAPSTRAGRAAAADMEVCRCVASVDRID